MGKRYQGMLISWIPIYLFRFVSFPFLCFCAFSWCISVILLDAWNHNDLYFFRGIDLESMSIGQRDALLLFRTLCKVCCAIIILFIWCNPFHMKLFTHLWSSVIPQLNNIFRWAWRKIMMKLLPRLDFCLLSFCRSVLGLCFCVAYLMKIKLTTIYSVLT